MQNGATDDEEDKHADGDGTNRVLVALLETRRYLSASVDVLFKLSRSNGGLSGLGHLGINNTTC